MATNAKQQFSSYWRIAALLPILSKKSAASLVDNTPAGHPPIVSMLRIVPSLRNDRYDAEKCVKSIPAHLLF